MVSIDKIKEVIGVYKTVIDRKIKRLVYIATLIAAYTSLEAFGLQPEIIVGGIPIYNLQAIGHASSDEILKYRAMGGIFLAHQKGGKQTFRFTANITGGERFLWYKLLETLQIFGTESLQPIISSDKSLTKAADLLYNDQYSKLPDIPQEVIKSKADIYDFPFYQDISEQEYVYHRTFPIITPSRIYTNMYLETLRMSEDVNLGNNTIEIDCAFRYFEAPTHYRATNPADNQMILKRFGKEIAVPRTKKFYTTYIPYKDMKAWRKLENLISLAWISKRIAFEFSTLTQKQKGKFFIDMTNLATTYTFHSILQRIKYPSNVVI